MSDAVKIIHLTTDRLYQLKNGWLSYETQARESQDGDLERRITLMDAKDNSTRTITFTETQKKTEIKKGSDLITVLGTFIDGPDAHERVIRITMNHARSDCSVVVLND